VGHSAAMLGDGRSMEMPEYFEGLEKRWNEGGLWMFALVNGGVHNCD
jgi:hypothetical protein